MRDIIASKEILTREEVMEVLKIGRSTFYKLIQTGQLKGFKEGNRYKVPVESIEEYVDEINYGFLMEQDVKSVFNLFKKSFRYVGNFGIGVKNLAEVCN